MSKNTERPTAVWIKRNDALHTMECSNCGADAHYQLVNRVWIYEPYCAHCGARVYKQEDLPMSENKKPRLAEVLGVEVGEVFYISDYPVDYGPVAVESDGKLRRVHGDGGRGNKVGANALYHLINQPECLSRRPRWTEQEVKDAKAIRRILPEARDIERITETLTIVRDEDGFCLLTLQKDMFPNVKEDQAAKLADIIGGNE